MGKLGAGETSLILHDQKTHGGGYPFFLPGLHGFCRAQPAGVLTFLFRVQKLPPISSNAPRTSS